MRITDLFSSTEAYKDKINEYRLFGGPRLRKVQAACRVGFVYTSNAIEGVSYTLSETKALLDDGIAAAGRPLCETNAVIGHARGYDHMFSLPQATSITEADVKEFHRLVAGGLESNSPASKYREQQVFISGSSYSVAAYEDIPFAMQELFGETGWDAYSDYPVLGAARLLKRLSHIHPFTDGNGQVSRLVMNTVLIQNGYTPMYIPPALRSEYLGLLGRDGRGDRSLFKFVAERILESQQGFLRMIRESMQEENGDLRWLQCNP